MVPRKKIEALTPLQEAELPAWRGEWLQRGLSTAPADRARAEAALRFLYTEIGEAAPQFLWVDSPATALLACHVFKNAKPVSLWDSLRASLGDSLRDSLRASLRDSLRDSLCESLGDSLWDSLRASLRDSLRDSLCESLGDSLGDSLRDSLRDSLCESLGDSLGDSLRESLWESLWDSLCESLWDSLRASLGDSLRDSLGAFLGWGSWEWWVPFYVYPRDILGVKYEAKRSAQLDAWAALMQSAGWWMPYKGLVIICERPSVIARDDRGLLDRETGPALRFRDGWSVWAWHGVRVPQQVIESPESLTATQIIREANAEVRRVMIERFGAERLMREGGGHIVDTEAHWPRPGANRLWHLDLSGDEPLALLEMINSSPESDGSYKHYFERVRPTAGTAIEAQASRWRRSPAGREMTVEEYRRIVAHS